MNLEWPCAPATGSAAIWSAATSTASARSSRCGQSASRPKWWSQCPAELARFVAVKGSLVVNGVSLTVNRVDDRRDGCGVSINLIPHTLSHTTLGGLTAGSRVNLEIDMIARYVERLALRVPDSSALTIESGAPAR